MVNNLLTIETADMKKTALFSFIVLLILKNQSHQRFVSFVIFSWKQFGLY